MSAPNAPIRFEGLWQDWLSQCHLNEEAVPVAPSPYLRGLLDLSTEGWACLESCPPEAGRALRCSLPFLPEKSTSQQSHGWMQHKLHVVERAQRNARVSSCCFQLATASSTYLSQNCRVPSGAPRRRWPSVVICTPVSRNSSLASASWLSFTMSHVFTAFGKYPNAGPHSLSLSHHRLSCSSRFRLQ